MKEKLETIALISAALIVTLLPVIILVATAVMNEYGAFGWAINIAFSLVFMAFSWVMTKNVPTKYFMIVSCVGAVMLLVLVDSLEVLAQQESWYNQTPSMWAFAYVTSTITAAMAIMSDWRTAGGIKTWLFWSGFTMIAAVAVWCLTYCIIHLCGYEIPKWCETIFLTIEGLSIFVGAVALAANGVSRATENGVTISSRCFHGSVTLIAAAFALIMAYVGITSWVMDLPTTIEGACGYLIGAGIIGIILSFGVMLIETYLDNRKAKKYRN